MNALSFPFVLPFLTQNQLEVFSSDFQEGVLSLLLTIEQYHFSLIFVLFSESNFFTISLLPLK